jgi:hypothetical protein
VIVPAVSAGRPLLAGSTTYECTNLSSYIEPIRKGLFVAGILVVADSVVAGVSMPFGLRFLETIGDLLLLEVAVLAIAGGLVEFSRSRKPYESRRPAPRSKDDFSIAKRSKKTIIFFFAAAVLFLLLIILALLG